MEQDLKLSMCTRCNQHLTHGIICQSCKNELLGHYEATLDWQTAYEIEKAQLIASRYKSDENVDVDF